MSDVRGILTSYLPLLARFPQVGNYNDLKVWRKSIDLVTEVYAETRLFPSDEIFGLRLQMRRAAASIPNNIAEGQGRSTNRDFRHFLFQARGSLLELETQILISERLHFLDRPCCDRTREIGKMLNGLLASLAPRV